MYSAAEFLIYQRTLIGFGYGASQFTS